MNKTLKFLLLLCIISTVINLTQIEIKNEIDTKNYSFFELYLSKSKKEIISIYKKQTPRIEDRNELDRLYESLIKGYKLQPCYNGGTKFFCKDTVDNLIELKSLNQTVSPNITLNDLRSDKSIELKNKFKSLFTSPEIVDYYQSENELNKFIESIK